MCSFAWRINPPRYHLNCLKTVPIIISIIAFYPIEYRAVADYVSDTEGDLSFKEGDMVLVYWGNDDGWWYGAAGSVQGWFPGSYIEV